MNIDPNIDDLGEIPELPVDEPVIAEIVDEEPEPQIEPLRPLPERGKGRRRLLVVAYYFPPMGLSGVVRISKFVKYLAQFGWDVTILTVDGVGYYAHDDDLLREVIDTGAEIVRTRTLDPLKIAGRKRREVKRPGDRTAAFLRGATHTVLQPDNKIGWKKHAVATGTEILNDREFDAIFATAPPFTTFLIARELSQISGVPFVVDYRDPWIDNSNFFYLTPFHKRYAARLEEDVLKKTESVVVVNRTIKEGLLARWPFLTHETVHILPSGYDRDDMVHARPERVGRKKLRLLFSGIFPPGLSPGPFFSAVARVIERNREAADQIDLVFLGTFRESYRKLATKKGVADLLVTPGYVPHSQVMDWLLSASVLWLTIADPKLTPGKLFEYMGTRRPILALSEPGVVRNLLDNYGAALYVRPNDVDGIVEAIESLYEGWKADRLPEGDEALSEEHDVEMLTGRLDIILSHAMRL